MLKLKSSKFTDLKIPLIFINNYNILFSKKIKNKNLPFSIFSKSSEKNLSKFYLFNKNQIKKFVEIKDIKENQKEIEEKENFSEKFLEFFLLENKNPHKIQSYITKEYENVSNFLKKILKKILKNLWKL